MVNSLPNELWICIIENAVKPDDWCAHVFFPPAEDFSHIEGFKNASREFRALVEETERRMRNRSVSVLEAGDLRKLTFPAGRLRHLEIRNAITDLKPWNFAELTRHFDNMESLSLISQVNTDCLLLWLAANPSGGSLRRLDLTTITKSFCCLPLYPQNLVELRLSLVSPKARTSRAESFMLQNIDLSTAEWNITDSLMYFMQRLKGSLKNLQRLRLLSVHVSLCSLRVFVDTQSHHIGKHEGRDDFRLCELCSQMVEKQEVIGREIAASKELAEVCMGLEIVRWMDIMKAEYFEEKCQREYRIVRRADGEICVFNPQA